MIHSLCWGLLQEALKPNDIPLNRLLEIFDSLPLSSLPNCFNWGHTYGGFHSFSRELYGIWEFDLKYNAADSEAYGFSEENPYNVPQVFTLLSETSYRLQTSDIAHRNCHSYDCFGNLPWEIREYIAEYLSTQDALALRQSSRAFLPLLDSPIFWASRFLLDAERAFLFEKRKTSELRDWLSLYRMTSRRQSPPGLKNRQRIWCLIEYIVQLLNLRLSNECYTTDLHNSSPHDKSMDIAVTGFIDTPRQLPSVGPGDPTHSVLEIGCQAFSEQYVYIPRDLIAICVFFVGLGSFGFLSGLRFKSACGADTQLGYSSAESQVVVNTKCLNGFCLATSQLGIRALQVVDGDGKRSSWVGSPQDMLLTEHLVSFDTNRPIQAKIDVSQ